MVTKLLLDHHDIYVIDNLCTSQFSNIESLVNKGKIYFYQWDIARELPDEIQRIKFDRIYNLASPASPKYFETLSIEMIETNVYGANNLLRLAQKSDARFFQASTSEVYGSALVSPQSETYWGNVNPNGYRSPYDEGKRCAEALIYAFKRKYGIDVRVARIFNTYGPFMKQDDGRVLSNFITQALTHMPITIYGDGNFTRSFCYVDDLVNGIIELMETDILIEHPINLGNENEVTIKELANKVIQLTGSSSHIVYTQQAYDDPPQRRPDLSLAKNLLNYEPTIQLDDGLSKTIDYFKCSMGKLHKGKNYYG